MECVFNYIFEALDEDQRIIKSLRKSIRFTNNRMTLCCVGVLFFGIGVIVDMSDLHHELKVLRSNNLEMQKQIDILEKKANEKVKETGD